MNKGMDNIFFKKLKSGNINAFETVFNLYKLPIYQFVLSHTKTIEVSEEITQEVFVRLWENRKKIDPEKNLKSYIYTIAKNLTLSYLREVTKEHSLKEELWNKIGIVRADPENDMIFEEYQFFFEEILNNLPQKKREIYILSKVEGKSNEEIASQLGITKKTVKNNLWETLLIIKRQLTPYLEFTLKTFIISFVYFYSFFNGQM